MANQVPESLASMVYLNSEFKVLLCLGDGCSKAVAPKGIVAHMRKIHHMKPELQRELGEYVGHNFELDNYDYSSIQLPANGSTPQPILLVVDGFQCKLCTTFLSTSRKVLKTHGNKKHKLKRVVDNELFQSVRLQTWFRTGKERYWIVDENRAIQEAQEAREAASRDVGEQSDRSDGESGRESGRGSDRESGRRSDRESGRGSDRESSSEPIPRRSAKLKQRIQEQLDKAEKKQNSLLPEVPTVEQDKWVRAVRWNEALGSRDIAKLHDYTNMPEQDDSEFGRLLSAWGRVRERCISTLVNTDHVDTLKWLGSPQLQGSANQRPFSLPQSANTMAKYNQIWERFICYAIRAAPKQFRRKSSKWFKSRIVHR